MKVIYSTTTSLAANAVLDTGFRDMGGSGDVPQVFVTVLANQAGTITITESETASAVEFNTLISAVPILASNSYAFSFQLSRRYIKAVYTNGSVAQTSFAFIINGTVAPNLLTEPVRQARLLELILRELRVMNMNVQAIKEPTGSTVSSPYGPNSMSN